jgi:Integrase core domain/Sugar (and other) transporter
MNRMIKEATVQHYHYDRHDQFETHLADFINAYNYARRLKTLKGLTPYEYICKCWTSQPERFKRNPLQQMPGLNTSIGECTQPLRSARRGRSAVLEPASIEISAETDGSVRRLLLASSLGIGDRRLRFLSLRLHAPIAFDTVFFPKLDPIAGLVAVYATFAIGFVARPLGGIIFGHYADRIGRKAILTMTLLIMGGASALIGCIPNYYTIGIASPVALVILRFLQGFAFGGE